jgi:hypothetical protein
VTRSGPIARRVRRLLACVTVLLLLILGCRPTPAVSLAHAASSPSALATAVLRAIERRDAAALRALAISEEEFRQHVWPELPSARPERNLPFSYVWGDLRMKSDAGLKEVLAIHGGRHYELAAIRAAGETTQYPTYLVHRQARITVKDPMGALLELRVFGSVLEKDGRFKVFSYVVD